VNKDPWPTDAGFWFVVLVVLPLVGTINVLITPPVWLFFAVRQRALRPKF
jgi:hypothetical protein